MVRRSARFSHDWLPSGRSRTREGAAMADKGGLEGVVVARSRLCSIDGLNGVLIYGGYDVRELAEQSSYEEVCFLTLHGRLPARDELDAFVAELGSERELSEETASVVDM